MAKSTKPKPSKPPVTTKGDPTQPPPNPPKPVTP